MKIVNLAMANIKKAKSAAISLFILIFIAGLLLNVGMTVIFKINTFYDDKVEELHGSHMSLIMETSDYTKAQREFLKSYTGVRETEAESIILMSTAKFRYGGSDMNSSAVLLNADDKRMIAPLKLIEQQGTGSDNPIYIPYSFKVSGGYKLGDLFIITYQDKAYSYRVKGFFETTMLGMNDMGIMKFFLPEEGYIQLSGKLGDETNGTLVSAVLKSMRQSPQLLHDYSKLFPHPPMGMSSSFFWSADIEMIKSISTMTLSIVAMILVAFAAVIVLVSLIVIKFRVANSIDDGMVNIGVLKAVGYTSRQILASITLQFMLIALSAGVAGVAFSYAIMPVFGGIISSLSGLLWLQSFNVIINLASILIISLLVLTVTLFSAARIKKLHPVAALRGGIMTHNFKKNFFPLDKARGGLHFVLACKTIFMNSRQNMMLVVIIAAITFASVFSIVLYYNVATDKTAFVHLVGAETSDVMVQAKSEADSKKLFAAIKQLDGVTKTANLDTISTKLDGQAFYTFISDDFSQLDNQTVYDGRYPEYDNEVAVSWAVAKQLHKGIGDTVMVQVDDASHSYLITGLSQSISNMGQAVYLTLPGVQQVIPGYTSTLINVYLKGIDNASFIRNVKAEYGYLIKDITDVEEMIKSQSTIYISAVFAVMVMIITITVLVVVLILYLVIKTMILKRKRELGILKATGYTTFQLMTQIAMSFVPIVIVGVLIGGVLGCLYTNSMLTLLLSGAGIHNVQFTIHIPLIMLLCMGLIVLAYVVSMLVSRRIKRITAYGLIME